MKAETYDKVLKLISQASASELEGIQRQVSLRYKTLNNERTYEAMRTIKVNDVIELCNIRPKYMDGARGTVTEIKGTKFVVRTDRLFRGRTSTVTVPASCLRLISSHED